MSSKVKERLKKMMLEMSHEERVMLDDALDKLAISMGMIIVSDEKDKIRGCDILIEKISDEKLKEIVVKIKKKKKKVEMVA